MLWAALAVDRDGAGGVKRAGWLLGVAVACQPLALLAVAPVVARFGRRDLGGVAWRLVLPSAVVTLPELITSKGADAARELADQPYNPAGESRTPFGHFARALGHEMYSGGTLRLIATLAAVALGVLVCRRRHDLPTVLLVMATAFTIRVLLESELLGFYFFPIAAICLLLLTLRSSSWSLFGACGVASIVSLVLGNRRADDLILWWPAIMATTIVMVGLAHAACRGSDSRSSSSSVASQSHDTAAPAMIAASQREVRVL